MFAQFTKRKSHASECMVFAVLIVSLVTRKAIHTDTDYLLCIENEYYMHFVDNTWRSVYSVHAEWQLKSIFVDSI
jgi:hypothetical protein